MNFAGNAGVTSVGCGGRCCAFDKPEVLIPSDLHLGSFLGMDGQADRRIMTVERPLTREWVFGRAILGHDYQTYYNVCRGIVRDVSDCEDVPIRAYIDDQKLRRSRYVGQYSDLGVYSGPVSFHQACLDTMPDKELRGSIAYSLRYLVEASRVMSRVRGLAVQDCLHAMLKRLTHHADVGKLSHFPAATVLAGLDRCTPPVQWNKDDLIITLTDWVGPDKRWAEECRPFVEKVIDHVGAAWVAKSNPNPMSLSEFVSDPFRWATSGGAPAVSVDGAVVRSKWAWAIKHLEQGHDLYAESANRRRMAIAALKEEPNKTRLVITTPMRSYLRQCYFMYVMGFPKIKSPICDDMAAFRPSVTTADFYISIDASKFDQQIPFWFVRAVFAQVARHPLLADLVREELEDIKNTRVRLFDTVRRYEGGVLSGWRMTSLIGSLASVCVCEYIRRTFPDLDYLVQGDDILLYGSSPVDKESIFSLLDQFKLVYDKNSTLVGREGVFLRRRYGRGPLRSQAGRALRQLFYANPWVTRGQFSGPRELANSWLQYISRMAVPIDRGWVLRQASADMARWSRGSGWSARVWLRLLRTDSGYGGLGTVDTNTATSHAYVLSIGSGYKPDDRNNPTGALTPHMVLLNLVAPATPRDSLQWMKVSSVSTVPVALPRRPPLPEGRAGMVWPEGVNKFTTLLAVLKEGRRGLPASMQASLPHYMRTLNGVRLVEYILRGVGSVTAPMHTCFPQIVVNHTCRDLLSRCNSALWHVRGAIRERRFGYYRHVLNRTLGRFMLCGTW